MKKLITIIIFIFTLASLSMSQTVGDNEIVKQKVKDVIKKNSQAFADRNIVEWANCYVQDERFTHIGYEKLTTGFQKLKNKIENFFKDVTITDAKISNLKIYVSGNVAWATYENYWVAKWKDSKKARTTYGYTTLGLVKQEGVWRILRYHETSKK